MTEITVEAKDCPFGRVTVYSDRAEVTRSVPIVGVPVRINIGGLVDNLDVNSLRVKGNPRVKILDLVSTRRLDKDSAQNKNLQHLAKKRENIKKQLQELQESTDRIKVEANYVNLYVDSAFKRVDNQRAPTLEETKEILAFQRTETLRLLEERNELAAKKDTLMEELEVVDNDILLNGGRPGDKKENFGARAKYSRVLTVSIECSPAPSHGADAEGLPPLHLSYIVRNASWRPSYDVRINTETNIMLLTYYGELQQNSGEDWIQPELLLSTAKPSIGAIPKRVPHIIVREKTNRLPPPVIAHKKMGRSLAGLPPPSAPLRSMAAENLDGHGNDSDDVDDDDGECSFAAEAEVRGDSIFTAFAIPQKSDVSSNGQSSKVVIGELSLSPQIIHYTVPTTGDISVYLEAKTLNDSAMLMLPSDSVSIFVDGAYISKSSMKQTQPRQHFAMYLGVDPSVKVSYDPIKAENKSGSWGSSNKSTEYGFRTTLHNTKATKIKCLVVDSLPKSNDDKIVVEILQPKPSALKTMDPSASAEVGFANLDDLSTAIYKDEASTRLMWLVDVSENEKKSIEYKYTISSPKILDLELHASRK